MDQLELMKLMKITKEEINSVLQEKTSWGRNVLMSRLEDVYDDVIIKFLEYKSKQK